MNSFFFQLFATKMLSFVWKNGGTSLACELTRDKDDNFVYENIASWEGFKFCSNEWGRAAVDYNSFFKEN